MLWGLSLELDEPQTITLTHGLQLMAAEITPKVEILSTVRLYCHSTEKEEEFVICTFRKGEVQPNNFLKLILSRGDRITFRAVQDFPSEGKYPFLVNLTGIGDANERISDKQHIIVTYHP